MSIYIFKNYICDHALKKKRGKVSLLAHGVLWICGAWPQCFEVVSVRPASD